jgi:hypothetical protein
MASTTNGQERTFPWRMIFRVVRWGSYVLALGALILIMHKSPAPVVETNPQAAARVEQKFEEVEQAVSSGQPATLRMDQTELNSYLMSHLDIASNPANERGTAAASSSSSDNVYASNRSASTGSTASPSANSNAGAAEASPDRALTSELPAGTSVEEMQSAVKDVKVELIEDRARAYVVFDFHGKDMTLQLEGRLGAQDGYLRFDPLAGRLGALPIPQSTLESTVKRLMESPENREKLKLPEGVNGLKVENGEIVISYK